MGIEEGSTVISSYTSQASSIHSNMLVATFVVVSLVLLLTSRKGQSSNETSSKINDDVSSKAPIAIVSAIIFSTGLFISGMTDACKVLSFLNLGLIATKRWDGTLMFVMGFGLIVSAFGYHFVEGHNIFKNDKLLSYPLFQDENTGKFNVPTKKKIDKPLIVGSAMFGLGWGIGGVCPGPALFLAGAGHLSVMFLWFPCNILGTLLGEQLKAWFEYSLEYQDR